MRTNYAGTAIRSSMAISSTSLQSRRHLAKRLCMCISNVKRTWKVEETYESEPMETSNPDYDDED